MKDWDPKGLWDELLQAVRGWMDDDIGDDEEQASDEDASLPFHLAYTAPVVIGVLLAVRALA